MNKQTQKKFICWVHGNPLVWIMKACCSIINVCMRTLCSCACLACEGNFIIPTPMLFIQTWRTCTQTNRCSNPCQLRRQTMLSEKKESRKKQSTHCPLASPRQRRATQTSQLASKKKKGKTNKVDTPAKWNLRVSIHRVPSSGRQMKLDGCCPRRMHEMDPVPPATWYRRCVRGSKLTCSCPDFYF